LFCQACTCQHNLPEQFKLKNLPGPSRICFADRQTCIDYRTATEEKQKAEADPNFKSAVVEVRVFEEAENSLYPPAKWAQLSDYKDCFLCHSTEPAVSCRCCGRAVGQCCARTLDLPESYELNADSPKGSVCLECRFFALSRKATFAPSKKKAVTGPVIKGLRNKRGLGKGKLIEEPVELPTGDFKLEIMFEGASKTIGEISVNADMNLIEVDEIFKKSFPQSTLFHYLCRGKGVYPEFWDIITAKYLAPRLLLRGGTVSTPTISVTNTDVKSEGSEVPQTNNPYLKRLRKPKVVKKVEEEEPEEPEIEFVNVLKNMKASRARASKADNDPATKVDVEKFIKRFKPPKRNVAAVKFEEPVAVVQKKKNVNPSDIDEILASRAKEHFGATS
jgi:hypothetical protein